MAQFFDLERTKMQISMKHKFIKIGGGSGENVYQFTELDDLEKVIQTLETMLNDWRAELNLEPRRVSYDA